MLVSLFLNLHEIPVEEKLDRIRKLNRRDLLIRMLPRIASDYKGQGDLETAEALYSEAIELIKNLSTPEERRPYWSNVIQKIDRRGDMELLRQAALEMYEWNRNNKGFSREKILEIDLEKAKDVESDERQKAVGSIWGVLSGLSLYTTPMSYLAKVGETEKALEMADEVMAFRSVMTGEVLKISDTVVIGSLESTLGECAETYALCGEFEKARAVWIDLLGIMEEKKINQHDSFYWPMIINVRHDMFRDDMRTLCLEWAEAVKSYEDENRPDMEIYRRIDMIKSLAFVLARYGFVDDAQRILDELLESVAGEVTDARQLGYYKANIAQAYANARFPDQARTVAESIEDAEPREDTLKRLVAIWDW